MGSTGLAGPDGATGATGATGPAGVNTVNNDGIPFVTSGHVLPVISPTSVNYFGLSGPVGGNPIPTGVEFIITDSICTANLKVYSYTGVSTTYTLYSGTPVQGQEAVGSLTALDSYTTSNSTPFTLTGCVHAGQGVTVSVYTNGAPPNATTPFFTKLVCQ